VKVRVRADEDWVTVVTNTGLTTATGAGGPLQAASSAQAVATAARET
jgi:hypothetical protein